jgi:hypothetical protein
MEPETRSLIRLALHYYPVLVGSGDAPVEIGGLAQVDEMTGPIP